MSRVRVKICGITRVEDALAAADAGVDAIGLNFYKPSPRYVQPQIAREICKALPAFINKVGLFVNETRELTDSVLAEVPLDTLQFHGDESPEYCAQFQLPYIKSVGVREGTDIDAATRRYDTASALLLDQFDRTRWGGTGETFDWALVPGVRTMPFVLAGGLNVANIASALAQVRPYAVDVSGGVERSRGIKDAAKMAAFIRGVMSA